MHIGVKVSKHFRQSLQARYINKFIRMWCIVKTTHRAEISCIPFCIEPFCFKRCLSAVRIWCPTLLQDPPKNKSEKRSIPAAGMQGMRWVSHFWPRGLIRQMEATDVSRGKLRDVHPRDGCVSTSGGWRDQKASAKMDVTSNTRRQSEDLGESP